ncbi:MAG: iron-containing alcohol dehydrogenase, partial [Anaerolineales bacterium]|nr:iron-containing alcohol dehydrogenase [Anaerolineales bacterium]
GFGTANQTVAQAQSVGATHLFVMVDPGVLSLLDAVTDSLQASGIAYTVYDKIIGNPDVAHTDAAAAAFRASGADTLLGIGGGSALDMAKGVRVLAGAPEDASSADFMSTNPNGRPTPPTHKLPPMIAMPTTAGTGSEVTPWGVVTDHKTQQKTGIGGVNVIPTIAIIDPELTYGLPPFLTAATGMDALSHLIEAYVSTNRNPILDSLILRGIRLISQHLRTAVAEPHHSEARMAMMEAAMLGGIAISSNWLGACHSLAHQLSTFADMHHGLACAIMLPPQMRFTSPHPQAIERYADIAHALDPDEVDAEVAADLVDELIADIGLPLRLSEAGVQEGLIGTMAEYAMKDLNWTTNPRPTTAEDMEAMYRAVF